MGKLYLIPTPIGNLQDITLRALQVLEQVDLILAEDTRTSGKLLQHFHISTPMLAHHKFNEHQALEGRYPCGNAPWGYSLCPCLGQ